MEKWNIFDTKKPINNKQTPTDQETKKLFNGAEQHPVLYSETNVFSLPQTIGLKMTVYVVDSFPSFLISKNRAGLKSLLIY